MNALVAVTGAGSGIGAAAARAFSAAGHALLLIGRRKASLDALGLPFSLCVEADVRERAGFMAAIAAGEARFGPVDCLVNNAGIAPLARVSDQDPAEWKDLVEVNCIGVLNGMQAVLPGMQSRRRGTVINVSSIAAWKSYPFHDAYGASKAFVHAATEGARRDMAPHGVRVMVISPGLTRTAIDRTMLNEEAHRVWKARGDQIGGGIAADEVARTMVFAYQMPQDVILQEIVITPTAQEF